MDSARLPRTFSHLVWSAALPTLGLYKDRHETGKKIARMSFSNAILILWWRFQTVNLPSICRQYEALKQVTTDPEYAHDSMACKRLYCEKSSKPIVVSPLWGQTMRGFHDASICHRWAGLADYRCDIAYTNRETLGLYKDSHKLAKINDDEPHVACWLLRLLLFFA